MNKGIFIVKLINPNSLCTYYKPGDYLVRAVSEWAPSLPSFDFSPREAAVFTSFKAAEKYINKHCGVGFTYEIIELIPQNSTIVKN